MEDVETVRRWLQKGSMCAGLDLKDAFLHVSMSAQVKKFLNLNGEGNYLKGKSYLLVSNVPQEY